MFCCVIVQDLALDTTEHPQLQAGVAAACVAIHQSVEAMSRRSVEELRRYTYVTPTSYLELLNTFTKLLAEKRSEIETQRARLATGLDKLLSSATQVRH